MQVVILHNAVPPDACLADQDTLIQAQAIARALDALGHSVQTVPCTLDLESARLQLQSARPDVVFQLVEALNGSDRMAAAATSLLDSMGLRYTGSHTEALVLSNHKLLTKERLRQAGLPTAGWIARGVNDRMPRIAACEPASFRPGALYMVKTASEHASFGLGEHSLVRFADHASLVACVQQQVARLHRPSFAEEFVDGREFNVSLLAGPDGPQVLPPAEIEFSTYPADKPQIVCSQAKWDEDSFEYNNTPRTFEFQESDRPLLKELGELARRCWPVFGLRGYVRVDFRVDRQGQPYILEINANPCISPDGGFAAAVGQAGLSYTDAIQRILDDALAE